MIARLLIPFAVTTLLSSEAQVHTLLHPEEPFDAHKTVVWSPLFQAGWDELETQFGSPPERIEPANPLMSKLDAFDWDAATVMPEKSWKTWSGPATTELVRRANREAAAIGPHDDRFTLLAPNPDALAVFGYLHHAVEFRPHFFRSTKSPLHFRTPGKLVPVEFFGVRGDSAAAFGGSVSVICWLPSKHTMAVAITVPGSDSRVILYAPAEATSFSKACETVATLRKSPTIAAQTNDSIPEETLARMVTRLLASDDLRIPYLTIESNQNLEDRLTGARHYPSKKLPWRVACAQQQTRFELDEEGARARVSTTTGMDPFGGRIKLQPRRLFLIALFSFSFGETKPNGRCSPRGSATARA